MRDRINLTDSVINIALKMAEGNLGAATVLGLLLRAGMDGFRVVLDLDDMNIRGSQIWVAYKDYCKQDLTALKKASFDRDIEMVAKINDELCGIDFAEKAVCSGASYGREEASEVDEKREMPMNNPVKGLDLKLYPVPGPACEVDSKKHRSNEDD